MLPTGTIQIRQQEVDIGQNYIILNIRLPIKQPALLVVVLCVKENAIIGDSLRKRQENYLI